MIEQEISPPLVVVPPGEDAPVSRIRPEELRGLGGELRRTFTRYAADRRLAEERWLRSLRQYRGIYDPDIRRRLADNQSRAYPRVTRVKCVSVVSRVMNLMFPGNEKNWTLSASPSPDMDPLDVRRAVDEELERMRAAGMDAEPTDDVVRIATMGLAKARARELERLIDDELREIGADQSLDYVALNRKVVRSGVLYGLGVLRGPFVMERKRTVWEMGPEGSPEPRTVTEYRPQFEFLPVWDFYPDMNGTTPVDGDGYFVRLVMTKAQLRKLASRSDFFGGVIKQYIGNHPGGDYTAQPFEHDLREAGVAENVALTGNGADGRYEVRVWHGPISARTLMNAGVDVADAHKADHVEAEVWLLGSQVIKAEMDPWRKLGIDVRTIHVFSFDEDDTSPVGEGVPSIMRDSQMSICAATRMLLDNASITCGPNLEVNTDLLRPDQDLSSTKAYKIWYREGTGAEAAQAAVRNVQIDGHMGELQSIVQMFQSFSDAETFVGPATGGDMERGFSEPMRTAAGASMLRGDAALPFKDIVRNFDQFTQSVITSLIAFNRKFRPDATPAGDYTVIARGATSLIAKEIRGQQVDQLAATLSPEERLHVDERKLIESRLQVRDLGDMLRSEEEVARARALMDHQARAREAEAQAKLQAEVRKILAEAFKDIAQGQKALAGADAATMDAATKIVSTGLDQLREANAEENVNGQDRTPGSDAERPATGNLAEFAGALQQ